MIALLLLALFSFDEAMRTDLIVHGKLHWSKVDSQSRITVDIAGGNASRVNPDWSPDPLPLDYDLAQERALVKALKGAHLGAAASSPSDSPDDRTLAIDVEDAKGNWHSAGTWSLPVKAWRRGRLAAVFALLEPLFDARPARFGAGKGAPR